MIDPIVREARGIDLTDDVLILDEAHNVENFARESASFVCNVADIAAVANELEKIITTCVDCIGATRLIDPYRKLKCLLESILCLVENVTSSDAFVETDDCESGLFHGSEMVSLLQSSSITHDEVERCRHAFDFILQFDKGDISKRFKGVEPHPHMSQDIKHIHTLLQVTEQQDERIDSKCSSLSCNPKQLSGKRRRYRPHRGSEDVLTNTKTRQRLWVSNCMQLTRSLITVLSYVVGNTEDYGLLVERRVVNFLTVITVKLNCLNAAVCFKHIFRIARSVVVTSGTLTPLDSFSGELGVCFETCKSLPHIIDVARQLYIGVAGTGPDNLRLEATFQYSSRLDFQNSIGKALVDYCGVIPGGIIVFFPSYRLMDQLVTRWRGCGIWTELVDCKSAVFVEPTRRGAAFDNIVHSYKSACIHGRGALLFAVCRGKLSEGIDFKDNACCAVIIIGIPYPHSRDITVHQKMKWNDRTRLLRNRKHLQTGTQWYEMQAFRAVNQAMGRVVRHRYDFGAIILMDIRFRNKHVVQQLPQWVRPAVSTSPTSHKFILEQLNIFYNTIHKNLTELARERGDPHMHFPL